MYFVDNSIKTLTSPNTEIAVKIFVWYCKVPESHVVLCQSINSQTIRHQWLIIEVELTPFLHLIALINCIESNLYRVVLYRNHVFWKPCNRDVDTLVPSKYDLALQKYYHSTILKFLMLSLRHILVILYSGGYKQMSES